MKQIEEFAEDVTAKIKKNTLVAQGMQIFLKRYENMAESGPFHDARISSALRRFGWVFGGSIRSTQGGYLRPGRRIPVNVMSGGRRRKSASRGKAKLPTHVWDCHQRSQFSKFPTWHFTNISFLPYIHHTPLDFSTSVYTCNH